MNQPKHHPQQQPQQQPRPHYQPPPPYYPPPQTVVVNNSGSVWKIVMALFIFFVVLPMVFTLSFCVACTGALTVPAVMTGQERDATRAQAEKLGGSLRNEARVAHNETGAVPESFSAIDLGEDRRRANGWRAEDRILNLPQSHGALVIAPDESASSRKFKDAGFCLLVFDWSSGESSFHWFDTRTALEDGIKEQQRLLESGSTP